MAFVIDASLLDTLALRDKTQGQVYHAEALTQTVLAWGRVGSIMYFPLHWVTLKLLCLSLPINICYTSNTPVQTNGLFLW